MGLTELVAGLEVLQSLAKISLWIAFQPTGLLTWLHGRFGMRATWEERKGFVLGLLILITKPPSCVWWTWRFTTLGVITTASAIFNIVN
jgi:hypothetical protein